MEREQAKQDTADKQKEVENKEKELEDRYMDYKVLENQKKEKETELITALNKSKSH